MGLVWLKSVCEDHNSGQCNWLRDGHMFWYRTMRSRRLFSGNFLEKSNLILLKELLTEMIDLSTVAYFMGLANGVCSNYQGDKFQTGSSSISFPSLVIELLTWGWHVLGFLRFRMESTCLQNLCCVKQFILSERQTGCTLSKWCLWKLCSESR